MNLTPREYEVVRLFALGRTWMQVRDELHIGSDTLQKHRSAAMAKADTDTMQGVWAALGWLRIPRASESDVVPSASSVVAVTGRPHRKAAA